MVYVPFTNLYAPLERVKEHVGYRSTDAANDTELLARIETASRQIDRHCRRHFYVAYGTRYFTADRYGDLFVDDLVSTGSNVPVIATDEGGDRTYATTWAATDYDLLPIGASDVWPPEPYTRIARAPYGSYYWPGYARGVRITAKWGYYEILRRSTVTAGAIGSTTATTFTASGTVPDSEWGTGSTLLLDSEQVGVLSISGTTVTIARGLNGTTPATHGAATPIDVYQYPEIETACLDLTAELWRLRDVAGGTQSSDEFGSVRRSQLMPFPTEQMLATFRSGRGMVA